MLKLLRNINPNKATGPDTITGRLLKELATEINKHIENHSLMKGHTHIEEDHSLTKDNIHNEDNHSLMKGNKQAEADYSLMKGNTDIRQDHSLMKDTDI